MGSRGRIAAGVGAGIVLVLALAQLLLPRVAASKVSARVGRYGNVKSVSVKAFPAVELLWGHADSVHVSVASIALSSAEAAKLVWESRAADSIDVTADSVRLGSLHLTHVSLRKRGVQLSAQATVSQADVRAALPPGFDVQLLRSEGGYVEVRATGGLFGLGASVDAVAGPSDGKLVAHPLGFLLEGLKLTLFADPHIVVQGVSASANGAQPQSYRLTMSARLRS
jgi:hypothetical protein